MKRKKTHVENILAQKIRKSAAQERLVQIDCAYVQDDVENWWSQNQETEKDDESLKQELIELLETSLEEKDKDLFSKIARDGEFISSICLTGLFRTTDSRLGYIVHEAMSNLFDLNDIKYVRNRRVVYIF